METILSRNDLLKVREAARIIEADIKQHVSITELGRKVYLNVSKLKYGFKQEYGVGPYTYLQQIRIKVAKDLILEGANNKNVALSIGFIGIHAETNFIKWFKKNEKVTPAVWKHSINNVDAQFTKKAI